ncbi:hypothetical protein SLS62_005539 [Diatrype stigma]|uniref:Uncharacterized protein n=1 Tax=Diatrype stigma TaxID=117547 RepID=A0AAN9YPQ1_9PEZI
MVTLTVRRSKTSGLAFKISSTASILDSQLEAHIDDWNEIVARRYHQISNPMSDDPGLQETLINCCLHFRKKPISSDDDMYAPNVSLWSAIVSRFNEIVGGHILDDWESARKAVVSICEPRYRMLHARKLAIPNNGLEKAIDKWNGLLKRRQLNHALEMAQTMLWPVFQEKIKAATERRIEEAIHRTNVAYIPRNLEEQQNLIARLGQICKDSIKADREKIVHQLEETPRSSNSAQYQQLGTTRKRKSQEDRGAMAGSEWDASRNSDDMGLLSKKRKHTVKKLAASFPKTNKRKKNTHRPSIEQHLLDLGKTMQSIEAHLAQ